MVTHGCCEKKGRRNGADIDGNGKERGRGDPSRFLEYGKRTNWKGKTEVTYLVPAFIVGRKYRKKSGSN